MTNIVLQLCLLLQFSRYMDVFYFILKIRFANITLSTDKMLKTISKKIVKYTKQLTKVIYTNNKRRKMKEKYD